MKKVLLAIAALTLAGSAFAQPPNDHDRGWHRGDRHDHQVVIPDRVDVRYVIRENRRIKITTTYHCERQRRGQCTFWSKKVERDVVYRDRRHHM